MRSVRSLGAMTVTSGPSRARTLGRLIAATMRPRLSRSIHDSLPRTSCAPMASASARKLGAESSGFSGIAAVTGNGSAARTSRTCVEVGGVDPVGDDGDGLGVVGAQLGDGTVGGDPDLVGRPVAAVHDEDDGRPEVGGDARVEGQLGARRDVGVVRPEHEHDLEPGAEGAEPLDDAVQRLVGVVVGLGVGHPEGLVVGLLDTGLADEHLDDVVDLVVGTGAAQRRQRTEDAHRTDLAQQGVEQAEGHGGLARQPLRRGDVDASAHVTNLSVPRRPAPHLDRRRLPQRLPHDAVALGRGGEPGQGRVVGVRRDLGDDADAQHADGRAPVDAEGAARVERPVCPQRHVAQVDAERDRHGVQRDPGARHEGLHQHVARAGVRAVAARRRVQSGPHHARRGGHLDGDRFAEDGGRRDRVAARRPGPPGSAP